MKNHRGHEEGALIGGALLTLAGLGLIGFGVLFLKRGVWMYRTFNFRTGTSSIAFPAAWIGLGILFFLLGALPWPTWLDRKNRPK
jgi:hypothetical protein